MVSTLSGPIAPHPYYDNSASNNQSLIRPVPRVRPEARDIAEHAHGSVAMLLQVEGYNAFSTKKSRAEPKDHIQENVRRMRQIQRSSKRQETERQAPVKALWKSTKYDEVGSRVMNDLQRAPLTPRPTSANYLRAHSRTGYIPMSARPASSASSEDDISIPSAQSAREVRFIRRELDFIKLNGKAVKHVGMKKAASLTSLEEFQRKQDIELATYEKGEVPKYLQERKQQWDDEEHERISSIPDPQMPDGHKLMPDAERLATLDKLRASERDLLAQLNSMPIRTDTHRVRVKKEELEQKLGEVDQAIKIFSRRKVFVKMNE